MRYEHLLAYVMSTPWAIEPTYAERVASLIVKRVLAGGPIAEDVEAAVGRRRDPEPQISDGVAVLPLHGPIFPKANLMTKSSGATSAEEFASAFAALCADDDVSAIVIDCDSPGGSVFGVSEAFARMRAAKRSTGTTVAAVSNYMMCSAAYYLAAVADEIVASPSSYTCSIGVVAIHESIADKLEAEGVDVTLIYAGERKADGNPFEPLGERAEASMQARIDAAYAAFVRDVADARGATEAEVRDGYGRGAPLTATSAVESGGADRVGTLAETVARMRRPQARSATKRRRVTAGELADQAMAALQGDRHG